MQDRTASGPGRCPVRVMAVGGRAGQAAVLALCAAMTCWQPGAAAAEIDAPQASAGAIDGASQDENGEATSVSVRLEDLGRAPDFTLQSYSGDRVSLKDHLGRGPLVIDFWATWCAPCRKALPHLQDIHDRYRKRGLTVLTISTDDPRNQPKIGPFLRSQKLTLPVLLDGDSRVARLFRVTTVPATFLLSAEGRIVALHRGYRDGDEKILEREIAALLADPDPHSEVR